MRNEISEECDGRYNEDSVIRECLKVRPIITNKDEFCTARKTFANKMDNYRIPKTVYKGETTRETSENVR